MNSNAPIIKRNRPFRKLWHWIVLILAIILIAGLYIYINFNNLLAEALQKSFNSSLISNVYELKFEKLRVNPIEGNINVINVAFHKREKPLHYYPYINSTIKLTTHKILLTKVDIVSLLQSNVLQLESIEIDSPEVELVITDAIPIFFPFNDSTNLVKEDSVAKKKSIEGFILKEFKLIDAGLTVSNSAKERELKIENLNISVKDFLIQQLPGQDIFASNSIDLSLGGLSGKLKREGFKSVNFQNFKLNIDSIKVEKTIDTLIYQFSDFNTGVEMLDLLTADSIFEIKMQSFQLSYKGKSIDLQGVSFTPTVKNELIPTKSKYRQTQFSGSLGSLKMSGVNFDTLSLAQKLYIEKISLDSIDLNLFVDKAKMIDPKKFPEYLGQKIISIPLPIEVKYVEAKAVNLVNTEKKENGEYAKIHVQRGTLAAQNITNLPTTEPLSLTLSAYIEGKAHVRLNIAYAYLKPEFTMDGRIDRFDLKDLNKLISNYAPAKINKGIVDEITFSGKVYRTYSSGTMKFLYHDLDVDLSLSEQKWQNDLMAFAANTYLNANNPPSANKPPRIVKLSAERDMNKGGFNIVLKSLLSGFKETMIMSKENRKAYKEAKKKKKK